jgi:hypothetical protein
MLMRQNPVHLAALSGRDVDHPSGHKSGIQQIT